MNKDEALNKIDEMLGDRHEHISDNNISILDHGSVSKSAADLIDQVNEGHVNPLEAFVGIKHMEETCKLANKRLKDQAIQELSNYGTEAKDLSIHGATLQLRNGAGRWDFKEIPEIMELKAKIKELEDQHKQAYKMDQKGNKMVSEHGETITPAIFTPGSEVIAVKLKK